MSWNPFKPVKKFFSKAFNTVKKYALDPLTWITGGVSPQLDLLDKGLRRYGVDVFGNKQQEINNKIANENNQLQKDSFAFNKKLASQTFALNKDIAYNGSQIKSADMAKAGLNPLAGVNSSPSTVSASNVNGPNLSQPDSVAQTGLQKIQSVVGLAMQAKQLKSSLVSSAVNNKATEAQTRYQELVNEYFSKHGVLPTQQNEWIAQLVPFFEKYGDSLNKLPDNLVSAFNNYKSQREQQKIDNIVRKNEQKTHQSYIKGKTDSYYGKKTINSSKYEASKYPPNEKGFIDWRNSRQGQEMIKVYGYSSARDFFFDEVSNFRKYNK